MATKVREKPTAYWKQETQRQYDKTQDKMVTVKLPKWYLAALCPNDEQHKRSIDPPRTSSMIGEVEGLPAFECRAKSCRLTFTAKLPESGPPEAPEWG